MSIENKTRVEKMIEKLNENKEVINAADKGAIEIFFSGESINASVKINI